MWNRLVLYFLMFVIFSYSLVLKENSIFSQQELLPPPPSTKSEDSLSAIVWNWTHQLLSTALTHSQVLGTVCQEAFF